MNKIKHLIITISSLFMVMCFLVIFFLKIYFNVAFLIITVSSIIFCNIQYELFNDKIKTQISVSDYFRLLQVIAVLISMSYMKTSEYNLFFYILLFLIIWLLISTTRDIISVLMTKYLVK